MGWVRQGQVYQPRGEAPWLVSHASVPFAEPLGGTLVRAWFSPRDAENRSYVAWIVFDLADPTRILDRVSEPVLALGAPGTFDDSGTMMSWIVNESNRRWLFYIGWNLRGSVPFHVAIGLAKEGGNGSWSKLNGPLLDRSVVEPFFCSNPCVLTGPDGLVMWYISGIGWEQVSGRYSATYEIRRASSRDGSAWLHDSRPAVTLEGAEFAIARPCVLRSSTDWTMWFCVRTRDRPYRLGAARSSDGHVWVRAPDLADLAPSDGNDWDNEMIAYPHVFDQAGERWMLYCGNGFGRTGFGLARWN